VGKRSARTEKERKEIMRTEQIVNQIFYSTVIPTKGVSAPDYPQPVKISPLKVEKKWGYELWLDNNGSYCGKILHFDKTAKFSMHYHQDKMETWYVVKGSFKLTTIYTKDASREEVVLNVGDIVRIPRGLPHQLEALEEAEIFEFSTTHNDYDSYRIEPGDSQKG
jgi:mannose-6-phosphate isomerase-like protein (cupin superfamily)